MRRRCRPLSLLHLSLLHPLLVARPPTRPQPLSAPPCLPHPPCPPHNVAGIKRLQSGQAQQDRFRLLLSDGEYSHSCMLATQLAEKVTSDAIKECSIIRLDDYISNQVQAKK